MARFEAMTPDRNRAAASMERLGRRGLAQEAFRIEAVKLLRSALSVDAAFFASVDPATLLFTSALAEEPLAGVTAQFLENEFARDDVNKFAPLASSPDVVASLDGATGGDRTHSARFREVLAPLGLGDEVRVALTSGGNCWGVLCLHRESSSFGFDDGELALLRRLVPYLAGGLRQSVALSAVAPRAGVSAGPGIIILDGDLSVVSINEEAERWLADIVEVDWPAHHNLPFALLATAAQVAGLSQDGAGAPVPTRLRRRSGGWIAVHASTLDGAGGRHVAVVLDEAGTVQVSSLLLAAHGFTPAQSRVAALVVQGRSTRSIMAELHISSNTLQEHLRAVFDKLGIGSRRELVAVLSGRPR